MVATSTVRAIVTFVVCVAVVGSVVAAPVAAADDDSLSDGDDEPIGVDTDNESVSVDAGDDGVTVGTDGIDVDADGAVDDPTAGSSGTTDPTPPDASRDDEELPVNYSDVPVSMIPADLCQGPPSPDLPDPPVDNPTPLPITNPPGAPLTQCDVFDPYDPPFDPTDLPDDPQYDYGTFGQEVGEEGVAVGARGGASPDSQWPRANTIAYVAVGPDGVQTVQLTRVDDGSRDNVAFSEVSHAPGTRNGTADGWVVTFGKSGGANVVCDGETCTFDNDGTPAPSESVPVDGSDDDGSAGPAVPCQPPVGPGDAPEPPVDPTNPPEPLPPVENPTPVPIGVPGVPIGPCDVFDPNDPPFDPTSPPEDPRYHYDVFSQEVGEDGVAVGVRGGASPDSSWPGADTIAYVEAGPDGVQVVQLSRVDDGSRDHVAFSEVSHAPGTRNGTTDGWVVLFGKSGGANVVCDGEACTFDNDGTPAPSESVPTGGSDDGDDGGAEVPCQPPVGPGDAPEPPVDPTNPPEPLPPVENPTPVPIGVPGVPIGPCDVFDPNDPPFDPTSPPEDPRYHYDVFSQEVGEDGVAVGARGGASPDSSWPGADTIAYVEAGPDGIQTVQLSRVDDGSRDHVVFSDLAHQPGTRNGTADGWVVLFGKSGGAVVDCDGEACTFDNDGTPVPSESVPTGGSGDGESSTSSSQPSAGTSGTSASGSTGSASPGDGGTTSLSSATASDTTAADRLAVGTFPGAFQDGLPDAASASDALLSLV